MNYCGIMDRVKFKTRAGDCVHLNYVLEIPCTVCYGQDKYIRYSLKIRSHTQKILSLGFMQ